MLDIGAHHSCWLLLQALFMIARALTANSTTAVRTINNGLCIATSTTRNSEAYERQNYRGSNEPRVNATVLPKRKCFERCALHNGRGTYAWFLFGRLSAQVIALNLDHYATHKLMYVRAGGVAHLRNHFRPFGV
jgi:hypothetical protein